MSDPFYGTAGWRALRAACLQRDPVCASLGCGQPSTHADHIVPRSQGGADSLSNLRGACESCHNRRSASGNAPLRAIGCLPDGTPRDPRHPWLSEGEATPPGVKLSAGDRDHGGPRSRTKFPRQ